MAEEGAGIPPTLAPTANALGFPFKLAELKSHLGLKPEPVMGLTIKKCWPRMVGVPTRGRPLTTCRGVSPFRAFSQTTLTMSVAMLNFDWGRHEISNTSATAPTELMYS